MYGRVGTEERCPGLVSHLVVENMAISNTAHLAGTVSRHLAEPEMTPAGLVTDCCWCPHVFPIKSGGIPFIILVQIMGYALSVSACLIVAVLSALRHLSSV